MKEFVDKLIERLEEKYIECNKNMNLVKEEDGNESGHIYDENLNRSVAYEDAISIVNQLAEEYKQCIKSSCSNCEVYDTEKHYCPKWCDVIKETVAEIEEDFNNNFCEWEKRSAGGIELVREPHRMKLFHIEEERKFCPYCGKKIKIAPYQPKGE